MCKVQGSTDLKNGSCFNKHYFKTIEDKINWGGCCQMQLAWTKRRDIITDDLSPAKFGKGGAQETCW